MGFDAVPLKRNDILGAGATKSEPSSSAKRTPRLSELLQLLAMLFRRSTPPPSRLLPGRSPHRADDTSSRSLCTKGDDGGREGSSGPAVSMAQEVAAPGSGHSCCNAGA